MNVKENAARIYEYWIPKAMQSLNEPFNLVFCKQPTDGLQRPRVFLHLYIEGFSNSIIKYSERWFKIYEGSQCAKNGYLSSPAVTTKNSQGAFAELSFCLRCFPLIRRTSSG